MKDEAMYLTGARIVMRNEVMENSALLIQHGVIASIEPQAGAGSTHVKHIDLTGQTLLPGLVDLHCDAIEKEVEPRSGVLFPLDFAVAQVDRRNAAAGITTPFHALSFANTQWGVRNNDMAAELVRLIKRTSTHRLVDNRVHCRYEMTDPTSVSLLQMLMEEGHVDLLSVMDHSPGQGQFKTLEVFVDYLMGNYAMDQKSALAAARLKIRARDGAPRRMRDLLATAAKHGIPIASHDDDSPHRIALMHELGVHMSEFPINLETSAAAIAKGLPTILGAPNVLRGQSQSGSMRAIEAIRAGWASCLCSDYQPATLIAAAFAVADSGALRLPDAVALVSANPATAGALSDRGCIAPHLRADLIAVSLNDRWPTVTRTWCAGRLVFSTGDELTS